MLTQLLVCYASHRRLWAVLSLLLLASLLYFSPTQYVTDVTAGASGGPGIWISTRSLQQRAPTDEQGAFTEEEEEEEEEDSLAPRLVVPRSGQAEESFVPEAEFRLRSQAEFLALVARNSSSFTGQDWQVFMAYKEQQYRERREVVKEYCQGQKPGFSSQVLPNTLVVDSQHGVAYCQIAKVASSTFCRHFIELANITESEKTRWRDALQLLAPKLWPAPQEQELAGAWQPLTSIVIVRHPLARLASVYYQKFVNLRTHKGWSHLVKGVVSRYRAPGAGGDPGLASPSEFLRYIIGDLRRGKEQCDQHWRPQHLSCPFCGLDFTVYARMEELDQDSAFFFTRANLTHIIDTGMHLNWVSSQGSREAEFWSSVDPWIVEALGGETCYKTDLDMFGYTVSSYMDGLNLDIQLLPGDLATQAPDVAGPDLALSPTWVPSSRGRRGGGRGEGGRPRQS